LLVKKNLETGKYGFIAKVRQGPIRLLIRHSAIHLFLEPDILFCFLVILYPDQWLWWLTPGQKRAVTALIMGREADGRRLHSGTGSVESG
jgi:hypothetical protein